MNAAAANDDPHHPSVIPPSPDEDEEMENTLDELAASKNNHSSGPWHPRIGGTTTTPCFALLAGVFIVSSLSCDDDEVVVC
jgi:hypothetical protein